MKMFSARTFISRSSKGGREKSLPEFSTVAPWSRGGVIRGPIDGGLNLRGGGTFLEMPEQGRLFAHIPHFLLEFPPIVTRNTDILSLNWG